MKLLLDQNISFRVVKHFKNSNIKAVHINEVSLKNVSDLEIWQYAKVEDFIVVTFDADFYDLQILNGFPPKIIRLRFGNTTSSELITVFENHLVTIRSFSESDIGCLELY